MKNINLKTVNIGSIVLDGVDSKDHPDYCDAYISYAEFTDGTELSDEDLDEFNEHFPSLVNELACEEVLSE